MLSASLRCFQTELCAPEVLQLVRVWADSLWSSLVLVWEMYSAHPNPAWKRPRNPWDVPVLPKGHFARRHLVSCQVQKLGIFGINCSGGGEGVLPRNPKGVCTDLCSIFTESVCCAGPEVHPSWSYWRYFEGRRFSGRVLHPVELYGGSH